MSKKTKTTTPPNGFREKSAEWHLSKFIEFTKYKQQIGEPSPHLAIVGWLSKDKPINDRLWLLGCYAATYCLPTAMVLWQRWKWSYVVKARERLEGWIKDNWKGIITRTERRCVRTPVKMYDCLNSYMDWVIDEYPRLLEDKSRITGNEYYDNVWESVEGIRYFGRYINIRLIEGLRRYCDIPARLYDIRSIGGWSPKKALAYLYPEDADVILIDDAAGNARTNELAVHLLKTVKKQLPKVDEYVLAAMLCEYKGAFEKRHQYPGWTIDQEPLLADKIITYWGDRVDLSGLWEARAALFPKEVLGEYGGWHGTRWDVAAVLRDHGYNWTDLKYSYTKTKDFETPTPRSK